MVKCTSLKKCMGDNFNGWAKWSLFKLLDSSFRMTSLSQNALKLMELWPLCLGISEFLNFFVYLDTNQN